MLVARQNIYEVFVVFDFSTSWIKNLGLMFSCERVFVFRSILCLFYDCNITNIEWTIMRETDDRLSCPVMPQNQHEPTLRRWQSTKGIPLISFLIWWSALTLGCAIKTKHTVLKPFTVFRNLWSHSARNMHAQAEISTAKQQTKLSPTMLVYFNFFLQNVPLWQTFT